MDELEPGDFLYQSDQELFLVVTEETKNSYRFSVHGWRDISKDRIEHYVDDSRSKVHKQDEIEKLVEEKGTDVTKKNFNLMKELFNKYGDVELIEDGPHTDFTLDE